MVGNAPERCVNRRRYKAYLRTPGEVVLPRSTRYRLIRQARERQRIQDEFVQTGVCNEPQTGNAFNNAGVPPTIDGSHDLQVPRVNNSERDERAPATVPHNNFEQEQEEVELLADDVPFAEALAEEGEIEGVEENPLGSPNYQEDLNDWALSNAPASKTSKFEILLMVMNFALRHGLTSVAVEDLLRMMNCTLGVNVLPQTKYLIQKVFMGAKTYQVHIYCPDCLAYLKVLTKEVKLCKVLKCSVCGKQCKVPGLNGFNFFITLPVKNQIADLLQNMDGVLDQLNYRWQRVPGDDMRDIYDGKVYKDLCREGGFLSSRYNLSLTFSTDGAMLYESGCTTLWPIFFRLNELHPSRRFDQSHCMIAGLWFGKREPAMTMFFTPFLKECKELYEKGFHWRAPNGQLIHSKVITLNCVLDSVARPQLQASKQYNGKWGCSYCDHPGVTYGESNMSKYSMGDELLLMKDLGFLYSVDRYEKDIGMFKKYHVTDRNNESMRRDMVIAEERSGQQSNFVDYNGIKGLSPLCVLPFFDVCFGFSIDYMHAVLVGTCKHLASLWFDSCYHEQPFYIRNHVANIDSRLLNIKPPTSISRRPRSIMERSDWHANEWRSWLLYYSLPCLKGILPTAYYKHHCGLVSSVYTFLRDSISSEELESATWALGEYVLEFQKLYPPEEMFFNVHLLLHLGKTVRMWGPLWCYSMFSFESGNNCIVKLVKGTTGVSSQIATKYLISKLVPNLLKVYTVSEKVLSYCEDLMCFQTSNNAFKIGEVTLLGQQKSVPLSDEERDVFINTGLTPSSVLYEKIIKNGVKYHARLDSRAGSKSDDSIVQLKDGSYAAIIRIFTRTAGEVHLLLREINTERGFIAYNPSCGSKAKHIKLCCPIVYGDLFINNSAELVKKSILMSCGTASYVTDFPNIYEKD